MTVEVIAVDALMIIHELSLSFRAGHSGNLMGIATLYRNVQQRRSFPPHPILKAQGTIVFHEREQICVSDLTMGHM